MSSRVLGFLRRGQVLYELEKPRTHIGRATTNDIVIDAQSVSKSHCDIEFNQSTGMAVVRDLQSRNGTFVNSERIQNSETTLMHGDYIRCGYDPENFKFEYSNPPTQAIPAARAPEPPQASSPKRPPPRTASTQDLPAGRRNMKSSPSRADLASSNAWASELRSPISSPVAAQRPMTATSARPSIGAPASLQAAASKLAWSAHARPATAGGPKSNFSDVQFLGATGRSGGNQSAQPPQLRTNDSDMAETLDMNENPEAAGGQERTEHASSKLRDIENEWSQLRDQLDEKPVKPSNSVSTLSAPQAPVNAAPRPVIQPPTTDETQRALNEVASVVHQLRTRASWAAMLVKELQHHSESAAERLKGDGEVDVWPDADVKKLLGPFFSQFSRGIGSVYPPAEASYDITALAEFVKSSLSESAEALDPALLQPMVTAHAAYLNSSQSALSQALKESRQAQAAVSAAQAQTHAERKRADEAVAGGAKGGMSPAESEAMRGYVIKLQKKLKDTQQALADKSAHVAAVLRRSESARAAAEYEMQLDTLRRSLALRDEEYQALLKSFGELEKKVMQHERPADAKSEIIQFLQDQARQVMLMKRSAAEQQRRATASAHRWTAKEEELEATKASLEAANRALERQQRQFRAALSQRDQHCFDLNHTLSELTTGTSDGPEMPAAEKKREAARYLLQNLERAMQANQEQMQSQAELEDKLAAAENECDRLRASLEQTLNNSNNEGKSMNTSANTLRAAKLVSRSQTVNTAAAPLAKRVEELEDLVTEHVEQASLQRVADLETACAASATAAADWEKKYKKLAEELEIARAAAPLDQSDIIEDLSTTVRRKESDVQRLQTLLSAAHAKVETAGAPAGSYTLQPNQPFNISLDGDLDDDAYFK